MTNFQRKYGIHNTPAPTHNRRHRKYARPANFSLPVGGVINDPIELNSYYPYGTLMAATTTEGTQPYKYSQNKSRRFAKKICGICESLPVVAWAIAYRGRLWHRGRLGSRNRQLRWLGDSGGRLRRRRQTRLPHWWRWWVLAERCNLVR